MKKIWSWSFAAEIFPDILKCLPVTVGSTLVAFVVAALVGLVLAVLLQTKIKWLRKILLVLVDLIRSTPLLVQLYVIYYVLPNYGLLLTPFVTGVIGLGIHYSTYLSEVYRSGIDAIPKGQWEAADCLGLTKLQTWLKIVIPEAIPPILPVIGNYLITMFKETPILSAISLIEILQEAKILGSRSFRYIEGFTIVGVLFMAVSLVASFIVVRVTTVVTRKYSM